MRVYERTPITFWKPKTAKRSKDASRLHSGSTSMGRRRERLRATDASPHWLGRLPGFRKANADLATPPDGAKRFLRHQADRKEKRRDARRQRRQASSSRRSSPLPRITVPEPAAGSGTPRPRAAGVPIDAIRKALNMTKISDMPESSSKASKATPRPSPPAESHIRDRASSDPDRYGAHEVKTRHEPPTDDDGEARLNKAVIKAKQKLITHPHEASERMVAKLTNEVKKYLASRNGNDEPRPRDQDSPQPRTVIDVPLRHQTFDAESAFDGPFDADAPEFPSHETDPLLPSDSDSDGDGDVFHTPPQRRSPPGEICGSSAIPMRTYTPGKHPMTGRDNPEREGSWWRCWEWRCWEWRFWSCGWGREERERRGSFGS
ncbi:hypothetical protein C7974DRAFT_413679 [Boeremia exigua]|uniref:uncharacterized protein n=1 Tax=Boeremia exigua TaxID=749465 RepID=UPI001E8D652F|nr:uncharacterized protein C7974DRAFT_413679 [Boeremia exigua]KAH6625147.1 hypothetical protein C7974DRAFT_413679 [Boeremia exigua]